MFVKMLEVLLTMNFIWSWLLVFPASVGMEWNDALSQEIHSSLVQGCSTITSVNANIVLGSNFPNSAGDNIKLTATLKGDAANVSKINIDKGCGRNTYNVVALYEKCGSFQRITTLLPSLKQEDESYVKDIVREVSPRGSLDYVFDGGTAVRYPSKKLPNDWFHSGYTISGWIYPQENYGRQYVLSWSDGDTPRHQNMGFFLKRKPGTNKITFGFFHTNEEFLNNCALRKKWTVNSAPLKGWHFVTLSISRTCSAELFIDGQRLDEIAKPSRVHIPEKHLQPKFVIGARWEGSASKYADYFNGKLSGFVLISDETINQKNINCLLECKDSLSLSTTLPPSFAVDFGLEGSLVLHGTGDNELISKLINDIVYVNDNVFPSRYQRRVTIDVENINKENKFTKEVTISVNRTKTSINISGMCNQGNFRKNNDLKTVKICPKIKVNMEGCTQFMDSMLVESDKNLLHNEKIYISQNEISRFGLSCRTTERGFVVYGLSTVEKYNRLLQNTRYSFSNDVTTDETFARKISISLSSHNGLVNSNRFEILIIPSQGRIFPLRRPSLRTAPVGVGVSVGVSDEDYVLFVSVGGNSFEPGARKMKGNERLKGLDWIVFAFVAGVFSLIPVVFFVGYRRYQRNSISKFSRPVYDSQVIFATPEYAWDEEGLNSCLKINPTERVSICNDPYNGILSRKNIQISPHLLDASSTTDNSEDEDDVETDFDNDSIRQLEWDCLEDSLDCVLSGEDGRCSSAAHSRTSELCNEDGFL